MQAAWCSECGRHVLVASTEHGGCEHGHPRSCLRDLREVAAPQELHALQGRTAARARRTGAQGENRTLLGESSSRQRTWAQINSNPPGWVVGLGISLIFAMMGSSGLMWSDRGEPTIQARVLVGLLWLAIPLVAVSPPSSKDTPADARHRTRDMVFMVYMGAAMSSAFILTMGNTAMGDAVVPQSTYALAIALWGALLVLLLVAQPWKMEDVLAKANLSSDGAARRTRVNLTLISLAVVFPAAHLALKMAGNGIVGILETGFAALLIVFACCLLLLQLLWAGKHHTLPGLRRRLAVSRPLMFISAFVGSLFLIPLVALAPFGRSRGAGRMLAEALAPGNEWLMLLVAIPILALAAWAAYQLAPIAGLRLLSRSRAAGAILGRIGAEPVSTSNAPLAIEALDQARIALGMTGGPQVYVAHRTLGLNGFVLFGRRRSYSLILSRSMCDALRTDELSAVISWLELRARAGIADWWNERAVDSVVDQATMHTLYAPEPLVSALEKVANRTGLDDSRASQRELGWALAPFARGPANTSTRIAALKGTVFGGEYMSDPLAWNDAIPEPVQHFLDNQ